MKRILRISVLTLAVTSMLSYSVTRAQSRYIISQNQTR